ncbi:MAG: hypothetical protein Q8903_07735 [Bacteroidota bacterium]|nr:hypothetical protein [Bacteroidota bacterium]
MKKFLLIAGIIFSFSILQFPQNINGRFSSSVYMFKQFDAVNSSDNFVRAYEMLNLNVNYSQFSLRTSMNLESDLSKKIDNSPLVRFYNFYLEGRDLFKVANVKLGRQPVFNNIGGGIFDGATIDLRVPDYKLTAYYGGNVPAYQKFETSKNWKDNYLAGGKLSGQPFENFQVDLSYAQKNVKPEDYYATRFDQNLNPITVLIQNNSTHFQFASAQVSYTMPKYFNANVRYDYDLNFEKTSKFEFEGRYSQITDIGIDVYYNYREPRINYNSIFSVFDYGNSQEIEAGVDYKINSLFTAIGKFGFVQFKTEDSKRITLGINSNYGNVTYRKTLGSAGELDALSLYAAYALFEGLLTPSAGISYTSYKLSEFSTKDNLTSLLFGVNVRPYNTLSFDAQGQYMNNKIYKNDFRFFLKLNYWFNTNLNLL